MNRFLATCLFGLAMSFGSVAAAEDCLLCTKDSDGACAGAQQCRGTRESCRKSGCKIGGTASCSTAANVKICSNFQPESIPQMSLAPAFEMCHR